MFRERTKMNGSGSKLDAKGTLTALWASAGRKTGNKEAPLPDAAPPAADAEPAPPRADQFTPTAASRDSGGDGAAEAATPTGGGDVAIGAAPEPSPEPAAATALAAEAQPEAPAEAQPSKASGATEKSKKKRKRSAAAEAFNKEQLSKLQALFAENQYANTAVKTALASELGVELPQVNKWFEKQRKKVREEMGVAPKRGRSTSGANGSKVAAPATTAAAAEPVAAAAGQENVAPAVVAAPAEAAKEQELEAMEVDAEPPAAAEAVLRQEQPTATPGAANLAGPSPTAAAPAAADEAEPMNTDAAPDRAAIAAAEVTPAAAPKPADAPPAAAGQDTAGAASPASVAATDTGSSPAAAAAAAPTTSPASALQQHTLAADDKAKLVADLESEAEALRHSGLAQPLHLLPVEPPAERLAFSDARLAAHVAAQRAPLTQLVAALLLLFKAPDGEGLVDEAVLRSHIVDRAARKSFAPKGKEGGSSMVDVLEDAADDHMWQWELRDMKGLPKELRLAAQQAKRRAGKVQERLTVVVAALSLLGRHQEGKASARLNKALDALQKVKTLAQVEKEQQGECEAAVAKKAAKKQQSAAKTGPSTEEKVRIKAEKEAAREAERAAKEAEKERAKAEKEAEKERLKVEKEAEKERKLRETQAAKLAKQTGFKDVGTLQKTSNKFMSFFQPKPAPGGIPGASAGTSAFARPCASSPQAGDGSQMGGGGASQQQVAEGTATGRQEKGYHDMFLKPEGTNLRSLSTQPCRAEAMDAARHQPFEQVQAEWRQLLEGMKQRRREAAAQLRPLGLPPTWARKPNAAELAQQHLDKLQQSGADLAAVHTWRRKLIWFPADSQRPAFYGSCKPSPAVRPRGYLGRDKAVDYEVMSDLEWVEEPEEGSSLTGAEEEESEMGGEEEEEEHDSFICADGYLSEDEGVQLKDLEGGDMQMDGEEGLPEGAAAAAGIDAQRLLSMQQLEVQMERAQRAGKPLIISRLPTQGSGREQPNGAYIQGDQSLLGALAAEVLLPGVQVSIPEDPAVEQVATAATGPATATKEASPAGMGPATGAGTCGGTGRPSGGPGRRARRLDDLLPKLLHFVQADPRRNKAKIADAFTEAHLGRKVPKKWVGDMLKENADWKGTVNGWTLKPAALQLIDPSAGAAAAPATFATTPTPGSTAVPAVEPAAVAAAADGSESAAVGVPVAVQPAAAPASAAVEPTPATAKPAAGGGIQRFFNFKANELAASPAVPSALRPNAPPSGLKAPDRRITMTAVGTAAAASPLVVPDSVSGTADPFWRSLLQRIEDADNICGPPGFIDAFQPATLARLAAGMPAGIAAALVTGVAAATTPPSTKLVYLCCLESVVAALVAMEAEAAGDNLSASQQVWQPRGAPIAASLAELCHEPQLLSGLQSCMEAARAAGGGTSDATTETAAAQRAGKVAEALLASELCMAALATAVEPDGGASPREQLEAMVAGARGVMMTVEEA